MRGTINVTLVLVASLAWQVCAFTPSSSHLLHHASATRKAATSRLFQSSAAKTTTGLANNLNPMNLASGGTSSFSNPLDKLPWVQKRELKRREHKIQMETNKLYRQLGIAEDSSFEEIRDATLRQIRLAKGDKKKQIKLEIAKDRIMELRLQARLAGLAKANTDADLQSESERTGGKSDEEYANVLEKKKASTEEGQYIEKYPYPEWTKNLIVKPDDKYRNSQIYVWGGWTALGFLFSSQIVKLGVMSLFVIMAQLQFRGVDKSKSSEGGTYYGRISPGKHSNLAMKLSVGVWLLAKLLAQLTIPQFIILNSSSAGSYRHAVENLYMFVACLFLKPKKD